MPYVLLSFSIVIMEIPKIGWSTLGNHDLPFMADVTMEEVHVKGYDVAK